MEALGNSRYYALRLHRKDDLRDSLESYCKDNKITSCAIISAVGCVSKLNLRMAKALSTLTLEDDFEIVSCIGTIAEGEAHIHCSFSDESGEVVGGHLLSGCIINTTCEVVLVELLDYKFTREYDEETSYDELVIKENN